MTEQEMVLSTVDGIAAGVTVGALLGYLPALAAVFTIVWTVLRIYEMKTVQAWLGKDPV